MSPSHAEILKLAFDRLDGDATLKTIIPSIYNHLPQDVPLPAIRIRWEQVVQWDTKDSSGWEGYLAIDVWTDHRGDKIALQAADRIDELMHLAPFSLTSGQSLILRHDSVDSFVEPDGITHHATVRFRHVATE